jgi:RNA polymerase sigma factor (sigma-70 family)
MSGRVPHLHIAAPEPPAPPAVAVEKLAPRTDDELMLLARGGIMEAFDQLVRRHQTRVLRVAARRLADREMAPDVAQCAFLDLYRALPRYQARGRFQAYLFRAVLNQCRMAERAARTERRHRPRPVGAVDPDLAAQQVAALDSSAETRVLERERDRDLERAVARLSERLRDVISLRYAAALGYNEIAETLGIPVGTVKRRLFDAVEKLRRLMEEP